MVMDLEMGVDVRSSWIGVEQKVPNLWHFYISNFSKAMRHASSAKAHFAKTLLCLDSPFCIKALKATTMLV
jgi:hypothetical protein